MKRIIAVSVASLGILVGVSATPLAASALDFNGNIGSVIKAALGGSDIEANENVGSVIKLSGSSEESGDIEANKNVGSVIKTSGSGTITANKNIGSVIKTSGSAGSTSGNIGSVIKIDGEGRDVNDVVREANISKNIGSVIKISNVCGDLDEDLRVSKNIGSVIKVDSHGDCDEPEQPKPETPEEEGDVLPAEMPKTGIEFGGIVIAAVSLLAGATTYLVRRHN